MTPCLLREPEYLEHDCQTDETLLQPVKEEEKDKEEDKP